MKYTVILLRPDYAGDFVGQDTYMDHVEATTPAGAIEATRSRAVHNDYGDDVADATPDDYFALAVFAGHLDDLTPGE